MKTLEKIESIINNIAQEPEVNITKIDNYTFKIEILGNLMTSFEKLGKIQTKILKNCNNKYDLKTIYGEGQDATLILEKKC